MKDKNSRRDFIKKSAILTLAGAGLSLHGNSILGNNSIIFPEENFMLPELSYGYDALEPHIDTLTMQIHHDKHHRAYVDNLNKAIKEAKAFNIKLEDMLASISKYPLAIRNNAGGHYNHSF